LVALLEATPGRDVVLVACDLPRLAPSILERLAALPIGTTAAPRVDSIWQPTVARYAASVLGEARGRLSRGEGALHRLLDAVSATVLAVAPAEISSLVDWDTPEDIPGGMGRM
jgi:molybdopterin-guanine dinucleotide biosynthesis protein A